MSRITLKIMENSWELALRHRFVKLFSICDTCMEGGSENRYLGANRVDMIEEIVSLKKKLVFKCENIIFIAIK